MRGDNDFGHSHGYDMSFYRRVLRETSTRYEVYMRCTTVIVLALYSIQRRSRDVHGNGIPIPMGFPWESHGNENTNMPGNSRRQCQYTSVKAFISTFASGNHWIDLHVGRVKYTMLLF